MILKTKFVAVPCLFIAFLIEVPLGPQFGHLKIYFAERFSAYFHSIFGVCALEQQEHHIPDEALSTCHHYLLASAHSSLG